MLNYFSTFADGNTADGQTGQGCTLGGTVSAANCRGADNAAESARRWNFGTADNLADYAFVVIDGTFMRLGGVAEAGLPGEAGNLLQTGEQVFSLSLGAGPHSIVFGVVDVGDIGLSSTLAIRQVLVTPVPEPAGLALIAAGLAVLRRLRPATGRCPSRC